jgi:hypothetical protein
MNWFSFTYGSISGRHRLPNCSAEVRLDQFLEDFRSGRNDKSGRPAVPLCVYFSFGSMADFPYNPACVLVFSQTDKDGVPQVIVWRPLGKLYLRN